MTVIEAYFCGWCFPPLNDEEGPHALVEIKYCDNTWEQIYRRPLGKHEGISMASKTACARAVLEHYLGGPVTDGQVDALVNMRGSSLCRLEPIKLQPFRQGVLF